jgi:hypothetical protein
MTLTIVEDDDGGLTAEVAQVSYPGGSEQTWSIEPCSDASSLFLALVTLADQLCFTFLATTTDGSIRPLADRVC